jgi:hypothetical protein
MRGLSPREVLRSLWCGAAIFALAASTFAGRAAAQSGQDEQAPPSLGELARRLRSQRPSKQTAQKVWTNDNLPKNPFGVSVVGPPPPPPQQDAAAPPASSPATPPAKPKTAAELEPALTAAQQKLDTLEKELDLAKRDFLLQQQGYYTNPMASQNPQTQAALAQAQQQIDAKQEEVDKTKAQIADLQIALDEAKKNPANPAPPKQQQNPPQN